jgi:hypothetical protein
MREGEWAEGLGNWEGNENTISNSKVSRSYLGYSSESSPDDMFL